MDKLTLIAPAKINWRLRITGQRSDGYHELNMFMQTISLHDILKITPAQKNELYVNGNHIPDCENNLIVKAADTLSVFLRKKVTARFDLQKRIPSMAGLGGGSSDCAQALIGLNTLYHLNIPCEKLHALAIALGSDVPFFLYGGLCQVEGIGERVTPLKEAPRASILLYHVKPGLSTPAVYKRFDECCASIGYDDPESFRMKLIQEDYSSLIPVNDLELPAISILPDIKVVLEKLMSLGAVYTMMSGSGSAVYGVFQSTECMRRAQNEIKESIAAYTTARSA